MSKFNTAFCPMNCDLLLFELITFLVWRTHTVDEHACTVKQPTLNSRPLIVEDQEPCARGLLINRTPVIFGVHYWLITSSLHGSFFKVILCAYEQISLILRYRYRSFKQLSKDPLHVLTDAYVLVLVDIDPNIFVIGCSSLLSDIHKSIIYAYHCNYLNIENVRKLV